MAAVYRKKSYHTGKNYKCWYYRFKDHRGKWRYGKGWPDKRKTLEHALAVEAEHRAISNGEKEVPGEWARQRNTPIQDVIDEYLEYGRVHGGLNGYPWAKGHYRNRRRLLRFWTNELKLQTLSDIEVGRVDQVAQKLAKTRSGKTVSEYLEAVTSLCHWAVKRRLLPSYPLAGLGKFSTKPKEPHRAFSEEEIVALLEATPPARQLLYRTALATGFRASELRALKVQNLDAERAILSLPGEFTKNREDAEQPISQELAKELAEAAKGKPAEARLLSMPKMQTLWENLARDLNKAKIERVTPEGKATFHSFRKNYITAVAASGADLKTIMTLARHKTAAMSMEVYAQADSGRLRKAAQAVSNGIVTAEKSSETIVENLPRKCGDVKLDVVMKAWPKLPDVIKAAIGAMITSID
jgi:integrase